MKEWYKSVRTDPKQWNLIGKNVRKTSILELLLSDKNIKLKAKTESEQKYEALKIQLFEQFCHEVYQDRYEILKDHNLKEI